MIFLVLALVILLLVSGYIIYNMYKKYDALETVSKDNLDFILSMRNRVLSQQSYLKQLDRRGAFESDDEIGVFFNELKKIITDIAVYLEIDESDDNGGSDGYEKQTRLGGRIERF
jgi:hypothetical protein